MAGLSPPSRMTNRTKATSIPSSVKQKVYARDGGCCVWCGKYGAMPEAHFIPRSKGGLGIEENILTLCRPHHELFDRGPIEKREEMRTYFRDYLKSKYQDWDETKMTYKSPWRGRV